MSRTSIIILLAGAVLGGAASSASAQQGKPIQIVAAENFYGDIAKQIGGSNVAVTSILTNPDQDPHLFEASASVARNLSAARLVIYNGIDYDPWVSKLLGAAKSADRKAIVVAELIGKKSGENPHIWYDPATMLALAKALSQELGTADPGHAADYSGNLAKFEQSLQPVQARIAALRTRLSGTPATATAPCCS
jgi:zinc/manganese transport system substrate-binding protein